MPTFGSLFSGIGGLDLGLERAGWECRWQVEIDEWCRAVLARHWPGVPRWDDAKTFPPSDTAIPAMGSVDVRSRGQLSTVEASWADVQGVDLICGGFPCQPVSLAGKRRGQDDERWLWPEFARIVRLLRPRYVLVENVPGLLARGMGDVLGDLAASGYDCEWDCIPAAAVGAPHLRYRVFIVAHANGSGPVHGQAGEFAAVGGKSAFGESVSSSDVERLREAATDSDSRRFAEQSERDSGTIGVFSGSFRNDSLGCDSRDWWATEPDLGRVAHGVPSRVDRLRGLGNAVVPQVAEWIGRRLMESA